MGKMSDEEKREEDNLQHDKKIDEVYQAKRLVDESENEKKASESLSYSEPEAYVIISDTMADVEATLREEEAERARQVAEKAEALLAEMNKEKVYILNKISKCPVPTHDKDEWYKNLGNIDLNLPSAKTDLSSLLRKIGVITTSNVSHTGMPRRPRRVRPHINLVELKLERRRKTVKGEVEIIESRLRHLLASKEHYDELRK